MAGEHGIPITPGSGATVRTEQIITTFGTVDQEVMTVGDPTTAGNVAGVTSTGELQTTTRPTSAATVTAVTAAASDAQILAANANRLGGMVYNGSSVALYVRLGTTAATTSLFSVAIPAGGYWEIPSNWRGALHGISAASPSGLVMVTEMS